jgi:hypothetical protein
MTEDERAQRLVRACAAAFPDLTEDEDPVLRRVYTKTDTVLKIYGVQFAAKSWAECIEQAESWIRNVGAENVATCRQFYDQALEKQRAIEAILSETGSRG